MVLSYNRIQAYSIESAGVMDFDTEMKLWFSGLGIVTFELIAGSDLSSLARLIGNAILT